MNQLVHNENFTNFQNSENAESQCTKLKALQRSSEMTLEQKSIEEKIK
jgi:hypothetical protein